MHSTSSLACTARTASSVLLVILLLGVSIVLIADDWPNWRGPTNNGISAEKGWSPKALSQKKILWNANVGKGYSSFAVANGKVYTMGNNGAEDTVYCFDAASGKEIWKKSYKCAAGRRYPGPRSTPAVDGKLVYTFSLEGHLNCFDADTGEVKWSQEVASRKPEWYHASSPIVYGDLVVLNAGISGVAYNKKSGKLAWSGGSGVPGYASPVVMKKGPSVSFLMFSEKSLICVNEKDGKPRWSFPWKTKYGQNVADPILVGNDKVFIASGQNYGCAMLEIGDNGVKKLWQNKNMRSHLASVVYHEGHLYGFDERTLTCLDVKTGKKKWTKGGFGKGALILADGKLIIFSEKGIDLAIAEATIDGYKEISRARVLGGHTWTSPVLANGRIYCRNDAGDIVCVDVSSK